MFCFCAYSVHPFRLSGMIDSFNHNAKLFGEESKGKREGAEVGERVFTVFDCGFTHLCEKLLYRNLHEKLQDSKFKFHFLN